MCHISEKGHKRLVSKTTRNFILLPLRQVAIPVRTTLARQSDSPSATGGQLAPCLHGKVSQPMRQRSRRLSSPASGTPFCIALEQNDRITTHGLYAGVLTNFVRLSARSTTLCSPARQHCTECSPGSPELTRCSAPPDAA